jgi:hypothetical protein
MLMKIITAVFYLGLALFIFHVGFPYLELLIGISALVIGVLTLL